MATSAPKRFIALLTGLALAGCGGGGHAASTGTGTLPQAKGSGSGQLSVAIAIPASSTPTGQAAQRRPAYVSTSTQSLAITVGSSPATNVNVTPTSTGCTSTEQINAPQWQEYHIAAGAQPRGITVGSDNALWFDEDSGGAIGRLTTSGGYTRYPNGRLSNDIVSAAGSLWAGDLYGTATLGNSTTAGVYSELPLGTAAGSGPDQTQAAQMAVGADGAIWFIEFDPNVSTGFARVGRVAVPASTTMEFNTQGSGIGIVSAPSDNSVWFTESNGTSSWLGRLSTTTYTLTNEFALTALGTATPSLPGLGPTGDNGIWFTDSASNMDRFDITTHALTRFPITTNFSERVVAGPDGALYFTEYSIAKVGRITTGGSLTEYATPSTASAPFSLTVGPDNALWIVEENANAIARLTFPTSVACAATIAAPSGTQTVTVTSYDATGGASGDGHALATVTTPLTITPNAVNSLSLTLNGVVNSLALSFPYGAPTGCPINTTAQLSVQALDAAGNLIIGPGSYVNAAGTPLTITLSDSDGSGKSTLSATTFTGPPATQPTLTFTNDGNTTVISAGVSGGTIPGASTASVSATTNC